MIAAPGLVAEGLGFTEGPLWTAAGRLLVVSVSRGLVWEIDVETGVATVFADTGGNPTGACADDDGTVWIAQGGAHTRTASARPVRPGLQAVRDGVVTDVVTSGHDAPNDCVIGPDGRVWFTDPRGAAIAPEGPGGRVCAFDRASGVVEVLADGIRFPNGLAFTADRDVLLVAETGTRRVLCYGWDGVGLVSGGVHATLAEGHPDGLALDTNGRLFVAATDAHAVVVVGTNGSLEEPVALPDGSFPTNVCFGGSDGRTLFVTAASGGRVWALEGDAAGLPLVP